ncbi:Na+/H+ antiporter NhaA [Candidatus Pacebacteria bacterium]|nr:Na+/H+ antiporter NhaA [Candidatus Paceibacterota bacterium]
MMIFGAIVALVWANAFDGYLNFTEYVIVDHAWIGHLHHGHRTFTLHYLVNDVLMSLFFFIAGKEVYEAAFLEGGSLRGTKSITPLMATLGGVVGPVVVYLSMASMWGIIGEVGNGWAIPTATDIAFAALVARWLFPTGHPAIGFLLLLAIVDDGIGLAIIAVFYPSAPVEPMWFLLSISAAIAVFLLFNRLPRFLDRGNQNRMHSTWVRDRLGLLPYILAGCASWYGFMRAGVHPALGLLPIIPAIPHAKLDFGIFSQREVSSKDLLNRAEHLLKYPVEFTLLLFGLCNAGVLISSFGNTTYLVLGGLIIGKIIGVSLFGWLAAGPLGFGLPEARGQEGELLKMSMFDLPIVGAIAGIGFTVALFVAAQAFDPGSTLDEAKMGALLSFLAAGVAWLMCRLFSQLKPDPEH